MLQRGVDANMRCAWVGAVVGGLASMYGAQESNRANRGAGEVDITRTTDPYQGSEIYRNAGAAAAYNQLQNLGYNTAPPPGGAGAPRPQTPFNPGGGGNPGAGAGNAGDRETGPNIGGEAGTPPGRPTKGAKPPAGYRYNAAGNLVKERGSGGGGGGGAAKPAGFQGQSPETAAAIANASRVAADMEKSPVLGAAQDYTAGTLRGEDQNDYRRETADMLRGEDSAYQRYLNALFESDTGLNTGSGGSTRPSPAAGQVRAYSAVAGPGGVMPAAPVEAGGPTGAAAALKRILAGEEAPGSAAMWERTRRAADEAFNEQLRQRRLEAAGSGMGGGTPQLADEQYAMGRYGSGLADARALQEYELYRNALGLGTGYDTASLDRAAQERMNAANNATSSAGISAGAAAEANSLASRERMARMGALGEAVGMGISGMGNLGANFSEDQRFALGASPDINAMGQAGYLNAGGLSLGSDQARNQWQNSQNALRGQLAGVGVQRQALAFDRERYYREAPLRDIAQYSGIISGTFDPYASVRESGFDRRNASPSYVNPGAAGLSGAAAGYAIGGDIYNSYRGNPNTVPAPG